MFIGQLAFERITSLSNLNDSIKLEDSHTSVRANLDALCNACCLEPFSILAVMIFFRIGQRFDHLQQPDVVVIFYVFQFRITGFAL